MKMNKRLSLCLTLCALVVAMAAPAAHAAWPQDHLDQAYDWILDPFVDPANNIWGDGASITVDPDGTVHASTKCGTFTTLLLKEAYPVITNQVLTDLTGSISPFAANWYNGILNQRSSGSIQFLKRTTVAGIQAGDILASSYTTSGDTGHVMTVKEIALMASSFALPADKAITGVTAVNKYRVTIYDSTKSPHGAYGSNPYPDTRYKQGSTLVQDTGIGSGTIVIYEDATPNSSNAGRIVGWAWNVSPTTDSFYYAVTPDVANFDIRPIVAGYLSGL